MAILILVRHGQSIYNLENRFTGSLDVPLTALGEKEALLAGQKLLPFTFDFAYTSTLKRAALSLRIIMEAIHQSSLVVIKSKSLDERNYGSLQGLNKEETIAKYGVKQVDTWRRSYAVAPPDGESLSDTFHRVVPFYKEKIEPQLKLQKNILVVAHGNSLRALVMYLEKMNPAEIAQFNIPTGIPRQYILDENLTILSAKYLL
jgi:2,3-bisphosphoglycerate-dependent phosphoglycerate mutase